MLTDVQRDAIISRDLPFRPCGLNADWSVSAWHVGPGAMPNHNETRQIYLLDNESEETYSVVTRQWSDATGTVGEDVIVTLHVGTLKACVRFAKDHLKSIYKEEEWALVGKPVVARAKAELKRDVFHGLVPRDVADFAEVHEHVDANYYGGALDEDSDVRFGAWDDEYVLDPSEAACAFWNRVQRELDEWIKAGGLRG